MEEDTLDLKVRYLNQNYVQEAVLGYLREYLGLDCAGGDGVIVVSRPLDASEWEGVKGFLLGLEYAGVALAVDDEDDDAQGGVDG